jgi:hypothetical protein
MFLHAKDVPELAAGGGVGISGNHAQAHLFVLPRREMEGELVVEIALEAPASEQPQEATQERSHP